MARSSGLRPPGKGKKGRGPQPGGRLSAAAEADIRRSARPTDQGEALSRLARAAELLDRGDGGRAAVEAEKAKAVAGKAPAVRETLGLAYYEQERWREALGELQAYRRLSGRQDQNHVIADCLRALGRGDEAVPLAEEELRADVDPDRKAEAAIVAASALADQGRFPEALAFLGRFRTKPGTAGEATLRLWYVRGDILAKAGRDREAAEEFRKIVRHDATAFDAAERLASLSG